MLKHWTQGLQIGFSNSMVSFFQPWDQYKAIKFLKVLGMIENIFSISALILVQSPWGQIQLVHQ
jgi:hypothetical protein